MKRSDIIKNIADIIHTSDIPGEWRYDFSIKVASEILTELENKGMLPPRKPIYKDNQLISWAHQWENENK